MSPWEYAAAMVGCGVGASMRYLLGRIDHPWSFPWPTVVANALGSILLGVAARLVAVDGAWVALVIGTGVAGGLTTFSSLAVDALVLWRDGRRAHAAEYLALTLAVGVAGAAAGWYAAGGFAHTPVP